MRFFFSKIAAPAMFFPCFFYFFLFFAAQMVFEVNQGIVLRVVGVSEKFEKVGLPETSYAGLAFSNGFSDFRKCASIFSGSVIEFFSPVSAYGETMTSPKANQKCNYSERCMCDDIEKKVIQGISAYILALVVVCGIGTVIWVIGLKIYYRFFF